MNSYFIFANVAKNIHPAKTYSIIYYFIGFTVRIRHEMFLKVTVLLLHLSCVFQHPIREKDGSLRNSKALNCGVCLEPKEVYQNSGSSSFSYYFLKQSLDFHKPGLCHITKI